MAEFQTDPNGIDVPALSRSECLAVIEYWAADGTAHQSPVVSAGGWDIEVETQGCRTTWLARDNATGIAVRLVCELEGNTAQLVIPQEGLEEGGQCRIRSIRPLPGLISGCEGDGSALVLPIDHGCLCRATGKPEAEHQLPLFFPFSYPLMCNMPIWGIDCGDGHAMAAIVERGELDVSLSVRTCWGDRKAYSTDAVFAIRDYRDEAPLAEDIAIRYAYLSGKEASYAGIARCYRRYNQEQRGLTTLKERMTQSEALEYSARAICLRCRMGVKQLPTPVPEQTPDTQPPLKVYMTFEDVRLLVAELARQEVGPTEICLAGWGYGGHDGAFPQLFPVEEKLGGEAELRRTIEFAHSLGYPLSLYDNYFDAYSLADTFDPETIRRSHDGAQVRGPQYAGGQTYHLCARCAYERYAVESLPRVAELGARGAYYVDELSLMAPAKCYHPEHPTSRRETVYWWKRIMREVTKHFGGFQSEGARDWALPELDRAYSVAATPDAESPLIDERIPLFPMVYHGFLIYNSFRSSVNAFAGDDDYLRNIAYGGSPIVYYHHIYNPVWSEADGISKDLAFAGADQLKVDVARIRRISEDVAGLAPLQTECIDDFVRHSPTLTETVYSDHTSVFVNYADSPCEIAPGQTVPAHDFLVLAADAQTG